MICPLYRGLGRNPYKHFVGIWVDLKTPKCPFEINWPLKAVDEIGLQLDSAKSTASSSNNPFDEHFRKALSSSKKVDDLSESEEKKEPVDDMLNTPLILQDIQSAPPSATVIPLSQGNY